MANNIDWAKLVTAEQRAAHVAATLVAAFSSAIQAHIDAKAQEGQYDSLLTAVTYRDDPNPQFAAEASALFQWRSDVWTYATSELARVQAGERTMPTVENILTELPEFVWP
ncbi:hypothetical protein [Aurantimonas coralicida]|uniref:hypothetical protein n=1 Tax=Aurantimonas coralicida TaxID=182270 RepID=UPI001D18EA44|nr:hypothetical protein [Aurantimonas coralicida]MCC4298557.1 hypothetical protein [Aurantimonas coralicida]